METEFVVTHAFAGYGIGDTIPDDGTLLPKNMPNVARRLKAKAPVSEPPPAPASKPAEPPKAPAVPAEPAKA